GRALQKLYASVRFRPSPHFLTACAAMVYSLAGPKMDTKWTPKSLLAEHSATIRANSPATR
ncbi:MAG: hypothetical protein WCG52_10215, partial [bacterium]